MNKKSGNATVYDVANAAGVSVSTVSRVLNGSPSKFSAKTKKQIFDAVRELNYRKQKEVFEAVDKEVGNQKVAVITPDIINPYYAALLTGLQSTLQISGIDTILYNSRNDKALEISAANQLLKGECSSVIIVSICDHHDHITRLIEAGITVVAFEQDVALECNKVGFNYSKSGFMATEFLIQRNYKKIGFISSPITRFSRTQIFGGYKKALAHYNIPFNEKYVKISTDDVTSTGKMFDYYNGINLAQEMISRRELPDAIFCINDITAIGVMQKLQNSGYRVPDDVGVMGFDNIDFSRMVVPALTTIDQSIYELGAMASEILIGNLRDSSRKNVSIVLDPKLVIRDSV